MTNREPLFGVMLLHSGIRAGETEPLQPYMENLVELGGVVLDETALETPLPLVYFMGTGGTEGQLLKLLEKRRRIIPNEYVRLLAHPAANSLPAALESLARIHLDGFEGRVFYLQHAADEKSLQELLNSCATGRENVGPLQQRIGLVGKPSDWLVASMPAPETVKTSWGPSIIPIDIAEVIKQVRGLPHDSGRQSSEELKSGARSIVEPSSEEIDSTGKIYIALKQIIDDQQLDAISVRCFDFVTDLQTTGCYALSQLNDDGIMAGCEGDLPSTLGLMWAHSLLDQIPWMANPAQIDLETNSLVLAHCTAPRSILKSYTLRSHFESGLGVGIQGEMLAGPVTLFRIGGPGLQSIWLAEGTITAMGNAEDLCRTQVKIDLLEGSQVQELLERPLGNHLVMVTGHHLTKLQTWHSDHVQKSPEILTTGKVEQSWNHV